MDLIAIQAEQVAWSTKNFGQQHERYPLLGMIEELLEFDEAWKLQQEAAANRSMTKEDRAALLSPELNQEVDDAAYAKLRAEVLDAIGDISIYMLDYCGKRGLQLNTLWNERAFSDDRGRTRWHDLAPLARRLAHHQLKGEQGIRGLPEEHLRQIDLTCRAILAHLEFICRYLEVDFLAILGAVWAKVSKRDWTKNKNNAHEVAEQQVIDGSKMAKNNDP